MRMRNASNLSYFWTLIYSQNAWVLRVRISTLAKASFFFKKQHFHNENVLLNNIEAFECKLTSRIKLVDVKIEWHIYHVCNKRWLNTSMTKLCILKSKQCMPWKVELIKEYLVFRELMVLRDFYCVFANTQLKMSSNVSRTDYSFEIASSMFAHCSSSCLTC